MNAARFIRLLLLSVLFMFYTYLLMDAVHNHDNWWIILIAGCGAVCCGSLIFRLFAAALKSKYSDK